MKIQRSLFLEEEKELTREKYTRLVHAARQKENERLSLVLQTICATGIRVSELRFITVKAVFTTRTGKPLDRSNIWRDMKKLCADAQVSDKKVFPHNLRHLFARTFYSIEKDISRLADIMGHTNLTTTSLLGSPLYVKQILLNLLTNAIKYNQKNGYILLFGRKEYF